VSAPARAGGPPEPGPGRPARRPAPRTPAAQKAARPEPAPQAAPQCRAQQPTPQPRRAPEPASVAASSPVRPVRAHTAPVRTGSLRARAPRPPAAVPDPRPTPAGVRRSTAAARRVPFVLLVVGLLVATSLGLLFLNTAIAVTSLRATQLAAANAERAEEVEELEQRVIAGGAPAALARSAADAGLVPAGPAAHLVIGPDGAVTLRGVPEPAEAPAPADGAGG
jgi:hypothetical protein